MGKEMFYTSTREYNVELVRGKKWFWRIKAKNGKILAHSEQYSNKSNAKKMAVSICTHLIDSEYREV